MVTEIRKGSRRLYICDVCGFAYAERKWAERCQKWCEEHHSCNLDITKHAVSTSASEVENSK